MPIRLCCPNGHTLEAPDRLAGTVIECPMCGVDIIIGPPPPVATIVNDPVQAPPVATLVVGPVPIPPPSVAGAGGEESIPELSIEEDESKPSDRPRPRRRSEARTAPRSATIAEKMQRVNLGLGFYYAKFLLIVAALVFNVLKSVGMALSKSPDGGAVFEVLQHLAILAETCMGLVGAVFLCFVPRKSRLRPMAITSAALEGAAVLLSFLGFALLFGNPTSGVALSLLGFLVGLGAWITFMLFLSYLATYLDDEATSAQVLQLMWMIIGLWVCVIVLAMGFGFAMKNSPVGRPVVLLGLGIMAIGFHVKFLIGMLEALGTMRQQIATRW